MKTLIAATLIVLAVVILAVWNKPTYQRELDACVTRVTANYPEQSLDQTLKECQIAQL